MNDVTPIAALHKRIDAHRAAIFGDDPYWLKSADSATIVGSEYDQLPVIDMGDLDGVEAPPREWIVRDWLPSRTVTLLAGDGGTGKSLFVQQWLTAIGTSAEFLGMRAPMVPTLYVNCEDEPDELHRRGADICQALAVPMSYCAGLVFTLSRAGSAGNELGTFDAAGLFDPSPFFRQIEQTAIRKGVKILALDNVAHLYAGNENIRGHVTQFLNACHRLACAIDGAVILIGHPAKVEGSTYSGSTAWNAGVRNRLFLERPAAEAEGGGISNDRILKRDKANYAAKDATLTMTWSKGAFVSHDSLVPFGAPEAATRDDNIFLNCLGAATAQRRAVSHSPNAGTYAPKTFARMSEAKPLKAPALAAAMERLFGLGKIEADRPLWRRENRTWVMGIAAAESAHGSVCTPVHNGTAQPTDIVSTPVHVSVGPYIHISGGASGGLADTPEDPDDTLDWSPR